MNIEVKIGALIIDPNNNTPIVVLKGVETETILPIWVGAFEANAIALEIEKIVSQRPMTHDLLKNIIVQFGLRAVSVVINDLLENTYYAQIELIDQNGRSTILDARPSDAIALALRLDCPIYVNQKVLDISNAANQSESEFESTAMPSTAEEWPDLIT